ncbi:cytochrome P450 [Streptomyces sp. NPDC101455]|uniref:cytochrome P450 n=1 Tax=Streptomyces sp. NPDC101455 TaxID=3366142 RepID=UPI0037FBADB3
MRPLIQRTADELIDAMLAAGPGADLVASYCQPLPSRVICHLLGVTYRDHDLFEDATRQVLATAATPEERGEAYGRIHAYIGDLITAAQQAPGEDLLSTLITEQVGQGNLSAAELTALAVLLLLAGHETTASTIALGVVTLLDHPDQQALVTGHREGAAGAADEMVRFHSLGDIDAGRVTTGELTVGGRTLPAGVGIIPVLSAGNRDPDVFEDPDQVNVLREHVRRHVGFGYGRHQCLGQNLARAELEIAYRTLFARIPGLRLTGPVGELSFKHDSQIFGLHTLPVTW